MAILCFSVISVLEWFWFGQGGKAVSHGHSGPEILTRCFRMPSFFFLPKGKKYFPTGYTFTKIRHAGL